MTTTVPSPWVEAVRFGLVTIKVSGHHSGNQCLSILTVSYNNDAEYDLNGDSDGDGDVLR